MMRATMLGLALVAGPLGLAAPAAAVPYTFDLTDPNLASDGHRYTFLLDSQPADAVAVTGDIFSVNATVSYADNGTPTSFDDLLFFSTAGVGGGFAASFGQYTGPALFTGPTSAPTFITGSYALVNANQQAALVVADATLPPPPPSAVPEPAAWMLLVGGFGLAGGALRARRGQAAVRFA